MSIDEKKLEKRIADRFNEFKSHEGMVGSEIKDNDPRFRAILKNLKNFLPKKILDVGCGKGRYCRKLKNLGFNVIGLDPSSEIVKIAMGNNKDIEFIQGSATDLPFSDNSFDFVLCVETLEHVPNVEKAISEILRVLEPGGKFVILDKNIISLHPIYFFPTFLWKKFLESRNKWFYQKEFPFKEKYFIPWKVKKMIKNKCSMVRIDYICNKLNITNYTLPKRIIKVFHNSVSFLIYKCLPFLSFFVVWEGEK